MTAHLLLLSELRRAVNSEASSALSATQLTDANTRLRDLIGAASDWFTTLCDRRFDRYQQTRYYTPFSLVNGGDLLIAYTLLLNADLRDVLTLTNGDDTTISSYTLLPRHQDEKWRVRLNPYGTTYFTHSGTDDPIGSIELSARWGYGGQWLDTGDAVGDDPLSSSATTITVTDADNFEAEMLLRADDASDNQEFMRCTAIDSDNDTITVERAYNGTTAIAIPNAATLYRFRADALVQRTIVRLCAWMFEQNKSPLVGQQVIGDFVAPVDVTALPADVHGAVKRLRWKVSF